MVVHRFYNIHFIPFHSISNKYLASVFVLLLITFMCLLYLLFKKRCLCLYVCVYLIVANAFYWIYSINICWHPSTKCANILRRFLSLSIDWFSLYSLFTDTWSSTLTTSSGSKTAHHKTRDLCSRNTRNVLWQRHIKWKASNL